jgi:hypothetical protein
MNTRIRPWNARLGGVVSLVLLLSGSSLSRAQPEPSSGNLPIFTSPIDITGLKVQLRATAPDRESGKPVDVALPVGLIGPKMNQLFSTPLSAQLDQYWNATRDPRTGMTGKVVLTLDGGTPLGTATVDAQGAFESPIAIPTGTSIGAHTIHAVDGDARANVTIQGRRRRTGARRP